MPSARTILVLTGDTFPALQYCERVGKCLSNLFEGNTFRVIVAVWKSSSLIGAPTADSALAAGPHYIGELPEPARVPKERLIEAITKTMQPAGVEIQGRVLRRATVDSILELVQGLNADLLVIDKLEKMGLIDHLLPNHKSLKHYLPQLVLACPAPVLVVPGEIAER